MTQLLPQFGNLAFTLIAFVVALSIIVAVHEYGHYIVGRWSGIHAEVFSLGFGPVLWARTDRRGTRWQIAALPFGGYVKFLGDANAASVGSDLSAVRKADLRRTMLGAPLWARMATVAAGPVFNFILSIAIFAGIYLIAGQARTPLTVERIIDLPPAYAHDLRPGDEIVAIDGVVLGDAGLGALADLPPYDSPLVDYVIRRDGTEQVIAGPNPFLPVVGGLNPDSAAMSAGLRAGDIVLSVDGIPIWDFVTVRDLVAESNGRDMTFSIWREGATEDVVLAPRRQDLPLAEGGFETRYLVGLVSGIFFEPATESLGPITALTEAASQVWFIITSSLSGLWHIVTGAISTCNLSGPVGIAQTSGAMASQGATSFIAFVAMLSTAVGLLNLFPVPMLDGGHLVFHAWEAVTGRPPADGALRILMSLGLTAILFLMGFALMNDLVLCP